MATKAEKAKRIALVERAIAARGWSRNLCRALASQFGVTERQVRRYRAELLQELGRDQVEFTPRMTRDEFLLRLRDTIAGARDAGRWGPAIGGLRVEMQVLGIDREIEPSIDDAPGEEKKRALLDSLSSLPIEILQEAIARNEAGSA